jgi:hypothetical protein
MLALPPLKEIRRLENGDYQIAHYLFKVKEMELWGHNGRKKLHNTIFYRLLCAFMETKDHSLSRAEINQYIKIKMTMQFTNQLADFEPFSMKNLV